MVIKEGLREESKRYLNEGKRGYSHADIIVYRLRVGEAWTGRERRKDWLKIGVGGALVVVGGATILLPTGSIFMIGAGCSLIVEGCLDFWGAYRKAKKKAVFILWKIRGGLYLFKMGREDNNPITPDLNKQKKRDWGRLHQNPTTFILRLKRRFKKNGI